MMLPLLPIDLITVEVVQTIFGRWSAAFPGRAGDFTKLYRHVINNYIGPRARFPVKLWCVCGRSTRTNNAAESSHAVLNASVRVSGAVSLHVFLIAIERQMQNTAREIEAGCPSHKKAVYARLNVLLARELSELFNGRQGVLSFLDHCSDIMKINNLAAVQLLTTRRVGELPPPGEAAWADRNRDVLVRAAVNLHWSICPFSSRPVQQIIESVEAWAFQPETGDVDLDVVRENSTLSFADQSVVSSFLEIRRGLFG